MINLDDLEFQFIFEKNLDVYNAHQAEIIEGRFLRAKHEGIQVVLSKDEFMSLDRKTRQDWAMIPMEPPWFWARGPICGPVTDMDDLITEKY